MLDALDDNDRDKLSSPELKWTKGYADKILDQKEDVRVLS